MKTGKDNEEFARKHHSGMEGKTNTPEQSGKNVQFNSGSGGSKGENYDGNSGSRNKPSDEDGRQSASDEAGTVESRTSKGFGKNPKGEKS